MREDPAPQTGSEISRQLPARKEATATWSRRKKERRVRRDKEDPVCTK
jgi:CelD/BcsL family acetyltransferase involved in cellulose biosynthesis